MRNRFSFILSASHSPKLIRLAPIFVLLSAVLLASGGCSPGSEFAQEDFNLGFRLGFPLANFEKKFWKETRPRVGLRIGVFGYSGSIIDEKAEWSVGFNDENHDGKIDFIRLAYSRYLSSPYYLGQRLKGREMIQSLDEIMLKEFGKQFQQNFPQYKTKRGITLGSPASEVIARYGDLPFKTKREGDKWTVVYQQGGIYLIFSCFREHVVSIALVKPWLDLEYILEQV